VTVTLPPGGVTRLRHTFTATPTRDAHYILRVDGAPGARNEPVSGERPFAMTNPLFVDVDGGGVDLSR